MEPSSSPPPHGLTQQEYTGLCHVIDMYHEFDRPSVISSFSLDTCTSLIRQVGEMRGDGKVRVGCVRDITVVSGLPASGEVRVGCICDVTVVSGCPASTSTERLELLDKANCVLSFRVVGGEHQLNHYKSVTSVNEFTIDDGPVYTIVLESYIVNVLEGNTAEDAMTFLDSEAHQPPEALFHVHIVVSPPPSSSLKSKPCL